MAKMSPVVHFEMGYDDKDRMVKFYEAVFGWKGQAMGPEMGNYVVAQTGPTDEKTMEPTMIPGVGLWISFEDTEGNRASMLQSSR